MAQKIILCASLIDLETFEWETMQRRDDSIDVTAFEKTLSAQIY